MRGSLAFCLLLMCSPAMAQTDSPPGGGAPVGGSTSMTSMAPAAASGTVPGGAAAQDYAMAMKKMMSDMNKPYTGDVDADFASHMIPHHQAAIDMAEIELKYGADPKMKQLAARIIAAQQREIAVMQAWAEKHPPHAGTAPQPAPIKIK